ncbi:hypothetical protein HDU96_007749 [Phlyctochytrium bullatum]|nr:hypothetical protein HDU96_007749 [Phlyctochytrium bullatum]
MRHLDRDQDASYTILRLLLKHGLESSWTLVNTLASFKKGNATKTATDRHSFVGRKFLELFLTHGALPNTRDDIDGSSALHYYAISKSDLSETCTCIRMLLKFGAYPDAINNSGYTALASAFSVGNEDAVRALIGGGANLNVKSKWPPLHTAVFAGALDIAKLLLDAGASPNFIDSNGKAPLHIALEQGKTDAVVMLLESGADPILERDVDGTPIRAFPFSENERLAKGWSDVNGDKTLWQKLCSAALRDRRLLQWVLAQGQFQPEKINEFFVMRDWLFSNIEGMSQQPATAAHVSSAAPVTTTSRIGKRKAQQPPPADPVAPTLRRSKRINQQPASVEPVPPAMQQNKRKTRPSVPVAPAAATLRRSKRKNGIEINYGKVQLTH